MRATKIDCKNCDSEYDGATDADCEIVTFCDLHHYAPQLLEMLKELHRVFTDPRFTDRHGYGDRMAALIAKCEGR